PRSCSMALQSETVWCLPDFPCTTPADSMAWAWSSSASVRVDFPASGCAIIATVRRRSASWVISVGVAYIIPQPYHNVRVRFGPHCRRRRTRLRGCAGNGTGGGGVDHMVKTLPLRHGSVFRDG